MTATTHVRFRHRVEYAGARLGYAILDRISLTTAEAAARGLGALWYRLDRSRRRTACTNLLRSGVAATPAEAARIAKASFEHFAMVIADSFKAREILDPGPAACRIDVDSPPECLEAIRQADRGLVVVSAHLGNWELAGQFLARSKPVVAIARQMNNPLVNALLESRQPRGQMRTVPRHDRRMAHFLSVLRSGQALAIMMDQHARTHGMMVDFFGRPASTHTSPAILHLLTGAPICFGYCLRKGPRHFGITILPLIRHARTANREQDVHAILTRIHAYLEEAIRKSPEQYLWAHRRWRTPS